MIDIRIYIKLFEALLARARRMRQIFQRSTTYILGTVPSITI